MLNYNNPEYSTVPLIAANYSVISDRNLVIWKPGEGIPTNQEFKYNVNDNFPRSYTNIPLIASGYSIISAENLDTPIPGESIVNEQLFPEIIYRKLSFNQNPNAFVNEHAFMAPVIPKDEQKGIDENTQKSIKAFDSTIVNNFNELDNFNRMHAKPESYQQFAKKRFSNYR